MTSVINHRFITKLTSGGAAEIIFTSVYLKIVYFKNKDDILFSVRDKC